MTSFQQILSTRLEDIKPPKNIPPGEYMGVIDALYEVVERGGTEVVQFPVRLTQSVNADPIELSKALNGRQLTDIRLNHDIWRPTEPAGKYKLKVFLHDHLGIEQGLSIGEALSQTQNRPLIVTLSHDLSKTPGDERVFLRIKQTAHV